MRRITLFLAAVAALAACNVPSSADEAAPLPKPPTLVVAISVDQFSADLFAQYRRHFTGGLARLQDGAVFPSGFQSHAATETCPGHATILTGVRPARSGIIANNWFDPASPRAEKRVYCAEDERNPASSGRDPLVSAVHLLVPTLGDRLKAANPASRNVAVSAKDRSAIMMGGHAIDAVYWMKGAGFATLAGRPLAPAAESANRWVAALVAKGAPALTPPRWCAARDRAVSAGRLTLGQGRFALEANKPDSFRVSPRMDGATVDLAIQLADALRLGKGSAPDVLSVSLSATDYVGHAYGTEGLEMCIQLAELDKTLGRLLAHLDASGIDYVAVLTADHGNDPTFKGTDHTREYIPLIAYSPSTPKKGTIDLGTRTCFGDVGATAVHALTGRVAESAWGLSGSSFLPNLGLAPNESTSA